ncbi:hypothetical protein Ciccas_003224 [Cichlidogyrus casuarinus]|uniref:DM domain-containing protein n=1 Tax=Cichlidogyrus casuarinus TaxID=1844966 RepID=A0ABD2QEZ3_9PLAT
MDSSGHISISEESQPNDWDVQNLQINVIPRSQQISTWNSFVHENHFVTQVDGFVTWPLNEEQQAKPDKMEANASRKPYVCRKCRNHGYKIEVRDHKKTCRFRNCQCSGCVLVNKGRAIVARQISLYRKQKHSKSTSSSLSKNEYMQNGLDNSYPHCRRCRNHNVIEQWRGHKKMCPYRNCNCEKCSLIIQRKENEKSLRSQRNKGSDSVEEIKSFRKPKLDKTNKFKSAFSVFTNNISKGLFEQETSKPVHDYASSMVSLGARTFL